MTARRDRVAGSDPASSIRKAGEREAASLRLSIAPEGVMLCLTAPTIVDAMRELDRLREVLHVRAGPKGSRHEKPPVGPRFRRRSL